MARIRSLKPEYWADQKLSRCSRDARLLYIALWNFADEQARMVGDPRQVKGLCFALDDDLTAADIDRLLGELAALGRVIRYQVGGERYLHLPKLADHQRLDDRQPSRYPAPPEHVTPPPDNPLPPAPTDFPAEVHGDFGEVQARARGGARALHVAGSREHVAGSRETLVALVGEVFDFWREQAGKPKARLDPKRRRKIEKALEQYPPEDIFDACRGWKNSPHHCGQNDRGTVYNDLDLLLRDAAHIEQFRDLARDGPPSPAVGKRTTQALGTYQAMLNNPPGEVNGSGNGLAAVGGDRRPLERELPGTADRTGNRA